MFRTERKKSSTKRKIERSKKGRKKDEFVHLIIYIYILSNEKCSMKERKNLMEKEKGPMKIPSTQLRDHHIHLISTIDVLKLLE